MSKARAPSTSSDDVDDHAATAVVKPALKYLGESQTLGSIFQDGSGPRVVVCDQSSLRHMDLTGNNIDLKQPFLLYQKRSVRKASAHSLMFDKDNQTFQVIGNHLLIPEDYQGYFAVLGSLDEIPKDQVVPYFRQAGKLAISPCTSFLIGGDQPVSALMVEGGVKRNVNPVPCSLFPGDVLRKGGIFEATSRMTAKNKLFKKKDIVRKEHFLHCFDAKDRELLIPHRTEGVFYIMSQEGTPLKCPIVTMKNMLQRFRLPLIAKLVFGRIPPTPCAFTGTMLIAESGIDRTVVASTLFNHRNVNVELPVSSGLKFFAVEHTPGLLGSRAYEKALSFCTLNCDTYIRSMKVDQSYKKMGNGKRLSMIQSSQTKDEEQRAGAGSASSSSQAQSTHFSSASQALSSLTGSKDSSVGLVRWADMTNKVSVDDMEHTIYVPSPHETLPMVRSPSKSKEKTPRKDTAASVELNEDTVVKKLLTYQKPDPNEDEIPIRVRSGKISKGKSSSQFKKKESVKYETIGESSTDQSKETGSVKYESIGQYSTDRSSKDKIEDSVYEITWTGSSDGQPLASTDSISGPARNSAKSPRDRKTDSGYSVAKVPESSYVVMNTPGLKQSAQGSPDTPDKKKNIQTKQLPLQKTNNETDGNDSPVLTPISPLPPASSPPILPPPSTFAPPPPTGIQPKFVKNQESASESPALPPRNDGTKGKFVAMHCEALSPPPEDLYEGESETPLSVTGDGSFVDDTIYEDPIDPYDNGNVLIYQNLGNLRLIEPGPEVSDFKQIEMPMDYNQLSIASYNVNAYQAFGDPGSVENTYLNVRSGTLRDKRGENLSPIYHEIDGPYSKPDVEWPTDRVSVDSSQSRPFSSSSSRADSGIYLNTPENSDGSRTNSGIYLNSAEYHDGLSSAGGVIEKDENDNVSSPTEVPSSNVLQELKKRFEGKKSTSSSGKNSNSVHQTSSPSLSEKAKGSFRAAPSAVNAGDKSVSSPVGRGKPSSTSTPDRGQLSTKQNLSQENQSSEEPQRSPWDIQLRKTQASTNTAQPKNSKSPPVSSSSAVSSPEKINSMSSKPSTPVSSAQTKQLPESSSRFVPGPQTPKKPQTTAASSFTAARNTPTATAFSQGQKPTATSPTHEGDFAGVTNSSSQQDNDDDSSKPNPWLNLKKKPTPAKKPSPAKQAPDSGKMFTKIGERNQIMNVLESTGGLKPQTISVLKGFRPDERGKILSGDLEVDELQPLLPTVGIFELNKLKSFLKNHKAN
ncbi:mucin-17 [Aplysia californica]|uniref:Mucin-17 n=1 Tax=Aplysia californica TaxID=6500 RepID=A0ABM0ZZX9_APLCA|nr:mucin-17 [Aplysia californica]